MEGNRLMQKVSELLLSIFSYMIFGYLLGLVIGFTGFDPDTDIYALLSIVFAIAGLVLGILPFFRRQVFTILGITIGFYLGMVIAILIWGEPSSDDLLEGLGLGGVSILFTLITALLGGFVGSRIHSAQANLPALALLLGGFLGGALFIALELAPASSMVGTSPFVVGSGVVLAAIIWQIQKARSTQTPE